MSALAPTLEAFFTERLLRQRDASPHTVAAYRDTMRLLLRFTQRRTRRQPSELDLADLDAPLVAAFLDHLEQERGNSVRTRNARLAAIHSLFRYAALRDPEHAELIQRVLSIPPKRLGRAIVSYLTRLETDALIAAPDRTTWLGRRDHALLTVAVHTLGAGRFVLNTLNLRAKLGDDPVAERLLRNMLNYAARGTDQPPAELPANFPDRLRAIGYN